MPEEQISIDEDFPYSDYTDEELIDKIKELSNKLAYIEHIENINKVIYYSQIASSELHNRQLFRQTTLYQSQVKLLQSQLSLAQTSIDNSKNDSKSARKFAIWALVVSALFGVFGIFDALNYFGVSYTTADKKFENKSIQLQEQQLSKQDSLLKSINQIHNDIRAYSPRNKVRDNKKVSDK